MYKCNQCGGGYEENIEDLKAEIKRLNNIKEFQSKKLLHKNYKLKQKLALTEKALELSCEVVNKVYAKPFGNNVDYTEYFKNQAKEMMKSE